MDTILRFVIKYKDTILIDIIGGLILAFLLGMASIIKKRLSPKPLQGPKEQAIYLSTPKRCFDDSCIGRYELLDKVFNKIVDGEKNFLSRKCIAITGEEGIGKSLFCYTLFQYYLHESPVYAGWIECNGKQSVFDIIQNTFKDLRFRKKNKDDILNAFANIDKKCVLFFDEINQFTPLDEIEELSHCPQVILILSGRIRKIDFADETIVLPPLSDDETGIIFLRQIGVESFDFIKGKGKYSCKRLLRNYAKGNPSLAIMFACAESHYEGKWEKMLESMESREYDDEHYFKNILQQLYRITELSNAQKSALSKLSAIEYENFTESVFEFLDIPDDCIESLCNTYWLKQEDSIMYAIDENHCRIISKLFISEMNLENAINSMDESLSVKKNIGFRWISLYVENILKRIRGYAAYIMEKESFFEFVYNVAWNYWNIKNYEKCIEWIELCHSKDKELIYKKARIEFQAKYYLVNKLYSPSEVEQVYLDALEKSKEIDDFQNQKMFLMQEYCNFLLFNKQYNEALLLCKEYFEVNTMDLRYKNNCDMFYRYLDVAYKLDDKESLERLVNEKTIQDLYQNERVWITAAWSFGELSKIFKKWGDKETSDKYMRHMVVLLNEWRGFYNSVIKVYLKLSEEKFAEYMHSCDELLDSLNKALARKDAEALYIEGRYQEKYGNYTDAFALYEEAAERDSLRGMCSLAVLYYRGQGEERNYDKARRYWDYCCKRGHRGSYYWLGILLLDTNYSGYDKKLALKKLTQAAELGSERAKEKLLEL